MPYERVTVKLDNSRDPSHRYKYHERDSESTRTPTVNKGGWLRWASAHPTEFTLLATSEWATIDCLFVESAQEDPFTVVYHDGDAARSVEVAAGARFYTEGISPSGKVVFNGLATGQAVVIYYYTSGTDS